MTMAVRIDDVRPLPRPRPGCKIEIGIWELLQWAFQRELASLDFDEVGRETGAHRSFGMEYLLIERARLGCQVDGGGRSDPHPDADVVASALAALPPAYGGRPMAMHIAELARAGRVPDWGAHVRPRCAPVGWKRSKHGVFAEREYWTGLGRWPANRLGRDHGYACRITFEGTARQVAAMRRNYLGWWGALLELRENLRALNSLTAFCVVEAMPPMKPWEKSS